VKIEGQGQISGSEKEKLLPNCRYNLEWRQSCYFNKKPSYRWGTARRGRASWNLV